MAENTLNKDSISPDTVSSILNSEGFNKLDASGKKTVIDGLNRERGRDGGMMGNLFGNNPLNASIHIAFILCVISLLIGLVCQNSGTSLWDYIFPLVGTAIGFFFGKNSK